MADYYRYNGKRPVYEIDRRDATKFPMPSGQWMEVTEPDVLRFLESMIANGSPRFEKQGSEPVDVVEVKAKRSRKKKPEEIQLEAVPVAEAVAVPEPVPEMNVKADVKPEPIPEPAKVEAKVEDDDPLGGI